MTILSEGCKPDNFEPQNSLKLSLTNIRGFHSNFIECESFLESNSPDILALCETNLDDSIDSSHFSVRGYLPLIQKDSITHMHALAVEVRFSHSTHLLMCLSLETLTPTIRTGSHILVEYVTVILTVLLFWIY